MLTKSHYAAQKFIHRQDRAAYRVHMCGLCHALGDGYGLAARLLTSHEMILLNLLTSAQTADEPEIVARRCPLNPLLHVKANANAHFAAAAAVELAHASVDDDVRDGGGIGAVMANRLLQKPHQRALQTLAELGFDTDLLTQLGANQDAAEAADIDASRPTAALSAELFAATARLSGMPHNAEPLAVIGAHYGAYLYLQDAYRDYAADMASGAYNPLRRFARYDENGALILPENGLRWLIERLRRIQAGIDGELVHLEFARHEHTVHTLLREPVAGLIVELEKALQTALAYRRWSWADVVKAVFFVMPAPVAASGMAGVYASSEEPPDPLEHPTQQPPKRKRGQSSSTDDSPAACFAGADCCDGLYLCAICGDSSDACRGCGDNDAGGCSNIDCNGCGDGCSGADCNCNN